MLKKIFMIGVFLLDAFLVYWAVAGQKADYMDQARELQQKQADGIHDWARTQLSDAKVNARLWQLSLQLLDGPKDRPSVIKTVKGWQKTNLPEELGGFVQDISKKGFDGKKIDMWKVAWKKNSITLRFDEAGQLADVDVNSLLGRSGMVEPVMEAPEAEDEEG